MLKHIKNWFVRLFSRLLPKVEDSPQETSKNKKRKRSKKPENWVYGEYMTAKSLLDDLEYRHQWLKGFKPKMSESGLRAIKKYGVYVFGAQHENSRQLHFRDRLDGDSDRPLPKFIAVAYGVSGAGKSTDTTITQCDQLLYAEKHKWKANAFHVERPKGLYFYIFGVVVKLSEKEYFTVNTAIEVMKDGTLEVLRMEDTRVVSIHHKKSCGDKRHTTQYRRKHWGRYGLPPNTKMEADGNDKPDDLIHHTKELFCLMYNDNLRRDASTSIHATKSNSRMIFTVPTHAWKDFFKDRITATAADGKKKRIFHHVAAHKRANGQSVPMHTRGLTRFKWKGFNIKICEWKKGRLSFLDFDITGEVMDKKEIFNAQRAGSHLMNDEEVATRLLPVFTKDIHKPSRVA